jgi:GDPmannose 4,6-dehydratase
LSPDTKRALIIGAAGQDGTLLAAHLDTLGYQIVGAVRSGSNITKLPGLNSVRLVEIDIRDASQLGDLIAEFTPDEIYHLAAFHHSAEDQSSHAKFHSRQSMVEINFESTKALAFAILASTLPCHLLFAGSSQMFTPNRDQHVISESDRYKPSTFYGHTKMWSADLLALLRQEYGLRASTAILFNHESHLRRPQFVSRKIALAAGAAHFGRPVRLDLLNVGARADWCAAKDVVRALHLIASSHEPRDYVVASGELHSVRSMLEIAFARAGQDWRQFTTFRFDAREHALCGDSRLIEAALGWRRTQSFPDMIAEMVEAEIERQREGPDAL